MNQLEKNFRTVIESWVTNFRLHRKNVKIRKEIRKHGKQLKQARKTADEMHKATGKTYFVLPDWEGNLQVLDKMGVRGLKKFKVMSQDVTFMDLLMESEYSTAKNYFLILWGDPNDPLSLRDWEFFNGTILEAAEKYKAHNVQIMGGWERIATIKDGKIIKH